MSIVPRIPPHPERAERAERAVGGPSVSEVGGDGMRGIAGSGGAGAAVGAGAGAGGAGFSSRRARLLAEKRALGGGDGAAGGVDRGVVASEEEPTFPSGRPSVESLMQRSDAPSASDPDHTFFDCDRPYQVVLERHLPSRAQCVASAGRRWSEAFPGLR
jgi:hypothetical protein